MQSKFIADTLEKVLHEVQRPARYVGGEINSIVKEWSSDRVKVALAFPDIYDLVSFIHIESAGMTKYYLGIILALQSRSHSCWRIMNGVRKAKQGLIVVTNVSLAEYYRNLFHYVNKLGQMHGSAQR